MQFPAPLAYIFRQPADWLWHCSFWGEQHPGGLWSRPLLYLHDVALDVAMLYFPLVMVRKAEAEAQRLVVKLSLTAVGWPQEKLSGGLTLESGGPAGAAFRLERL